MEIGTTTCMRGTVGCTGGTGGVTGDGCSAGDAGSPPSAIFTYYMLHIVNDCSYPNCIFNWNVTTLNYMFL